MACKTSFELNHNFPKVAEESGFAFNTHRPRVQIDWNKIKIIDIESLIRNRNFTLVEQHIYDILDCVIDLEFDVRILDEGFLKIFRLAQLAVEYQQFCRHYLDRSVFVLREEITKLLQELDSTKKSLHEKDEELKRIKRKMKHTIRTPLPYGNENIASMILKTLNQNKSDLFASTPQVDTLHYNKCKYCDKVFLNQLYLKGHISRRHETMEDIPQKDLDDKPNVNAEINNEISELKIKLKQMEDFLLSSNSKQSTHNKIHNTIDDKKETIIEHTVSPKKMVDAEVSTNDEGYILEKIQEWKKEEHDNYNKEINLLRTQVLDILSNKQIQNNTHSENEIKMVEQLHLTIKEQGTEILALKQELQSEHAQEAEKKLNIETQLNYWTKQSENQSNQLKSLLKKLNDLENEARESRARADAETVKSAELQKLLQQNLTKASIKEQAINNAKEGQQNDKLEMETKGSRSSNTTMPLTDQTTLQRLQQRAQELLEFENTISSDTSTESDFKTTAQRKRGCDITIVDKKHPNVNHNKRNNNGNLKKSKILAPTANIQTKCSEENLNRKEKKSKIKLQANKPTVVEKKEAHIIGTGSPIKIVRAKVTEEVHNRLVSLGVDPLKNKLPKSVFIKQRMFLQKQQEEKAKKCPSREAVLHHIMARLDLNTTSANKDIAQSDVYVSPNKSPRAFSISSVLSNVKTKALSLVKSNDIIDKSDKAYDNVAKKAMFLLKSPPGSRPSPNSKPSVSQNAPKSNTQKKHQKDKYMEKDNLKMKAQDSSQSNNDVDSESSDEQHSNRTNDHSLNTTNLMKSPIRHPTDNNKLNFTFEDSKFKLNTDNTNNITHKDKENYNSSDGIESLEDSPPRKTLSADNLNYLKQTKGVLKNASSTSSINKKKVLFDMNAIQVKSVSASPSQSLTEKTDNNEQYELGINNLGTEEWDLSSIEDLPLPDPSKEHKTAVHSYQSPKIAELTRTIESQLSRRNHNLTTALVGGVDVLSVPLQKGTSLAGSNTSLGSSILDDSDIIPVQKPNKNIIKAQSDKTQNIFNIISDGASF